MANFINVQNLHYAKLTTDTSSTLTYDTTMKAIPGTVKISVEPATVSADYWADGQKAETVQRLGDIKISIQTSSLDLPTIADLLGHTYDATKGTIVCSQDDIAPYIALAYERVRADGTKRLIKVYKVMFGLPKDDGASATNSINFQDDTLDGTALPLANNGEWKFMLEPNETNTAAVTAFYTAIIPA